MLYNRFTILTDECPRHESKAKIPLIDVLRLNKVSFIEVTGYYEGTKEKSYLTSLKPIQAKVLGKAYGQDSILSVDGFEQNSTNHLIFCQGDKPDLTGTGYKVTDTKPEGNCYTILPNGQYLEVFFE